MKTKWIVASLTAVITLVVGAFFVKPVYQKYHEGRRQIKYATQFYAGLKERSVSVIIKDNHNHLLKIDPQDSGVSFHLVRDGSWESHMGDLFSVIVQPKDKILSIGAHIGYHVLQMAQLTKEEGYVYAVEANPANFGFLKNNIELNHYTNCMIFNKAAYSEPMELQFMIMSGYPISTGGCYVLPENTAPAKNGTVIKVEGVTIDSLLPHVPEINLIQMDIEGCEMNAIQGAKELIKRSPRLTIIQEWFLTMMQPHGSVENYIQFWRNQGYFFGKITPNNGLLKISDSELLTPTKLPYDVVIAKDLENIQRRYNCLLSAQSKIAQ